MINNFNKYRINEIFIVKLFKINSTIIIEIYETLIKDKSLHYFI